MSVYVDWLPCFVCVCAGVSCRCHGGGRSKQMFLWSLSSALWWFALCSILLVIRGRSPRGCGDGVDGSRGDGGGVGSLCDAGGRVVVLAKNHGVCKVEWWQQSNKCIVLLITAADISGWKYYISCGQLALGEIVCGSIVMVASHQLRMQMAPTVSTATSLVALFWHGTPLASATGKASGIRVSARS